MAPPEIHAILNASASERWLNCTPSALLAAAEPAKTSDYAEEGRIAHQLAEAKVRAFFRIPGEDPDAMAADARSSEFYGGRRMEDATDDYLAAVCDEYFSHPGGAVIELERRVDYSDAAPGGFGTADCIIASADHLSIIDYKNGSGVNVDAVGNTQMRLYAYGALKRWRLFFGAVDTVRMIIVQPHAGGVKTWQISRDDLLAWIDGTVRPAAQLAAVGAGEFNPGAWCDSHFCPVKHKCRARAAAMLAGTKKAPTPAAELSDDEIGEILQKTAGFDKWIKSLQEYALTTALHGGVIPGFKVVEGRGSRDWNPGSFEALQANGIPEALLYERKPVSVAGLEKELGKKVFSEVAADLWTKRSGKPTLVPESDKRAPYDPAAAAFGGVAE